MKKGTESRSLEDEDRLFTVTLDEALALLAVPKQRGGRAGGRAAAGARPRPGVGRGGDRS